MDVEKAKAALLKCNELGVIVTNWAHPDTGVLKCKLVLQATSPKNITEAFSLLRDVSIDIDNIVIFGEMGGALINGGAETIESLYGKDFRKASQGDLSDLINSIVEAEGIREGRNEKISEENPQ